MQEKKTYQVGRGKKYISNWKREENHISSKREKQNYKKNHINIFKMRNLT
jgi:hypothetical protein